MQECKPSKQQTVAPSANKVMITLSDVLWLLPIPIAWFNGTTDQAKQKLLPVHRAIFFAGRTQTWPTTRRCKTMRESRARPSLGSWAREMLGRGTSWHFCSPASSRGGNAEMRGRAGTPAAAGRQGEHRDRVGAGMGAGKTREGGRAGWGWCGTGNAAKRRCRGSARENRAAARRGEARQGQVCSAAARDEPLPEQRVPALGKGPRMGGREGGEGAGEGAAGPAGSSPPQPAQPEPEPEGLRALPRGGRGGGGEQRRGRTGGGGVLFFGWIIYFFFFFADRERLILGRVGREDAMRLPRTG